MSSVEKLDVAVNLRRGEAFKARGGEGAGEAEWNGLREGEGRTLCDFRGGRMAVLAMGS